MTEFTKYFYIFHSIYFEVKANLIKMKFIPIIHLPAIRSVCRSTRLRFVNVRFPGVFELGLCVSAVLGINSSQQHYIVQTEREALWPKVA